MKQWKYRKIIPYILLGSLTLFFCWLFVLRYGVFGAKGDWMSQHSVTADYFRQQFYETGQLFPQFAANIGGGQNIYNFSYYGLYSPIVLLSYLLPFVKMGDYMMAAGITGLMASVLLFYRWLLKNGIAENISFLTALCFLLSGPMIFQSYSQIMFVNYMPFLCLALMGADAYFEKKKKRLYTCGVFLMILTSFYFSIGGMLVLVLYGIYRYLRNVEETGGKVKLSTFLADGIKFLMPMLAAVLMSGILLVPTAAALAGKRGTGASAEWKSLLMPEVPVWRFVYTPYGIGLTTLVISVLVAGLLYRKWSERVLHLGCIVVLTVPLFAYLLNGGLYIRDKVMIPFLPLLCYLIAYYLEKQRNREISFAAGLCPYVLTILLVYLGRGQKGYEAYGKLVIIDAVVMLVCFFWYYRKRDVKSLILAPIVFLVLYGSVFHNSAGQVADRAFYHKITDTGIKAAVEEIVEKENGFYRMEQMGTDEENEADMNRIWSMGQYSSSVYSSSYNAEYQQFRRDTFLLEQPYRNFLMQPSVQNPVFQKLMGVKYILSERDVPGYELYKTVGKVNIYKNEKVLPAFYVTDQVMSEEAYRKLEYPYNQTAFLRAAVVRDTDREPEGTETVWETALPRTEYRVKAEQSEVIEIPVANARENDILFLTMKVKNHRPSKDVAVWLDGERNKLTSREHIYYNGNTEFHYAVRMKSGQKTAALELGKGDYELTELRGWICRENDDNALRQPQFRPDKEKTKGNRITGSIYSEKDGYLITSIPYDSAFEVRIDGKQAEYEKVNTAFMGVKIEKGSHEIEMIYHAPGVKTGTMLSLIGMLLFFLL